MKWKEIPDYLQKKYGFSDKVKESFFNTPEWVFAQAEAQNEIPDAYLPKVLQMMEQQIETGDCKELKELAELDAKAQTKKFGLN